jgi:O-antigen/teichoic acid export membrane protein
MKYIAFIPSGHIILPLIQPFLVELRKVKNAPVYFAKQFNASFFVTMLIGTPIATIMFFHDDLVTAVLLGPNWAEYSNLLGAFGMLIPAFIMLNQASRVLVLHGKTKHIFIYECIAFVLLYSTLFLVGMDDLLIFTYVRVGMENLICGMFLAFILIKYTSAINALFLLLGLIPLALAVFIAHQAVVFIPIPEWNVFFQLVLVTSIFYITFYGTMLILHVLLLRRLSEWQYLEQIVLRIIKPLIGKVA